MPSGLPKGENSALLFASSQRQKDKAHISSSQTCEICGLDSRSLLMIILAGDQRLAARLGEMDLLPIASRIRSRLRLEELTPQQLQECLNHLLKTAGNPRLLTTPLIQTLCEHAAGNLRLLMNMAHDLLARIFHESFFHEICASSFCLWDEAKCEAEFSPLETPNVFGVSKGAGLTPKSPEFRGDFGL